MTVLDKSVKMFGDIQLRGVNGERIISLETGIHDGGRR